MSARMRHVALGAVLASGVVLLGSGQPTDNTTPTTPTTPPAPTTQGEPGGQARPRSAATDPEVMRARLTRMIESLDTRRERLVGAVEMLDNGATPEEVWATIRERPGRDWWSDRGGPSRVDQRPPPPDDGADAPEGAPPPEGREAFGGRGPEHRGFERLSDEAYADLREMIRNNLQPIDEGLTELEQRDPEAARAIVERLAPRLLEVRAVREHDGELTAIRLEEIRAGAAVIDVMSKIHRAVRDGDDDTVESLRGELREAIERQFDARAKAAAHEIESMEARLRELRQGFEDRREGRDAEIDAAVERAVRRATFRGKRRGRSDDD